MRGREVVGDLDPFHLLTKQYAMLVLETRLNLCTAIQVNTQDCRDQASMN